MQQVLVVIIHQSFVMNFYLGYLYYFSSDITFNAVTIDNKEKNIFISLKIGKIQKPHDKSLNLFSRI